VLHGALTLRSGVAMAQAELDRFCDALISIREEIAAIESGESSREDNLLKVRT
jgi:glycine dehydrogenase